MNNWKKEDWLTALKEEEDKAMQLYYLTDPDLIEYWREIRDFNYVCPICIEEIAWQDITYLDGCSNDAGSAHAYCYSCILQWSTQDNRCPVCKQKFLSLMHNIQNDAQFSRTMVEDKAVDADTGPEIEIIGELNEDLEITEEGITCRACLITMHSHTDFFQHLNGNRHKKTLRQQQEDLYLIYSRLGQTSNRTHWKSEKIRYSLGTRKRNKRQGGQTRKRTRGEMRSVLDDNGLVVQRSIAETEITEQPSTSESTVTDQHSADEVGPIEQEVVRLRLN